VNQGAAPDDGCIGLEEVLDAHHLHAVRDDRVRAPAVAADMRALRAHHEGHVRAGDVGVQQANARAVAGEADGQVDRDRRLADAALSRGNGDRVAHTGNQVGGRPAERALHVAGPVDPHDAGSERAQGIDDIALDGRLERAGRRRELDREVDDAAVDGDVLDHPERDEVTPDLGILHPTQRGEDVLICQLI
jgi:hypothetical protein